MKVHHVKKARKDQHACGSCRKPINRGDPYKWAKGRYTARMIRCGSCHFKPSDLTSSKMGTIWDSQEDAFARIAEWDDADSAEGLQDILSNFAETVREVAEEYRDSVMSMPDHLQDTSPVAIENTERADELEAWADSIDCTFLEDFDVDGMLDESRSEAEDEYPEDEYEGDEDSRKQAIEDRAQEILETKRSEWAEEQRDNATTELDNCPV